MKKGKFSMTKIPKAIRTDVTEHVRIIQESRDQIKKGNYITWEEFKNEKG